jgi:hypothetical protein
MPTAQSSVPRSIPSSEPALVWTENAMRAEARITASERWSSGQMASIRAVGCTPSATLRNSWS